MNSKEINLLGKVCPYPVMYIIREVDMMRSGENVKCLVDDPLATKSVLEELEDYDDVSISIVKLFHQWEINIARG
ncbi:MAG: sulfurtransferase TusA family protein [bacterium]|nr:sulfurtransferase TusA family protein [bacterium]